MMMLHITSASLPHHICNHQTRKTTPRIKIGCSRMVAYLGAAKSITLLLKVDNDEAK